MLNSKTKIGTSIFLYQQLPEVNTNQHINGWPFDTAQAAGTLYDHGRSSLQVRRWAALNNLDGTLCIARAGVIVSFA